LNVDSPSEQLFYLSYLNRNNCKSNSQHLSNRALITLLLFYMRRPFRRFRLFISQKSNITYLFETRALLIDLRVFSTLTFFYLPSLYLALSDAFSHPPFPSFVLLQLLSHLQAFLSRSRIVNSVSISAAASPLSIIPARRASAPIMHRTYIWCTRFCNERARAANVYPRVDRVAGYFCTCSDFTWWRLLYQI